jgi:hypothetical protein
MRDIDAALAIMHPEVEWANGTAGAGVRNHNPVRAYGTCQ